jgi:hypothetical protein
LLLQLDEWVLCRLYNKKNSWQKIQLQKLQLPNQKKQVPAVQDEGSFGEPGDSYGETDSFHESEIDNTVDHTFPDFDSMGGFASYPTYQTQAPHPCFGNMPVMRGNNYEPRIKEDNEWYYNLKLDDLQTTRANFGSGAVGPPPIEVPGQEFYFSALNSPPLKFNHMPF